MRLTECQQYECESCGSTGIVHHDSTIIQFCPICGESIHAEECDTEDVDEDCEYDDV